MRRATLLVRAVDRIPGTHGRSERRSVTPRGKFPGRCRARRCLRHDYGPYARAAGAQTAEPRRDLARGTAAAGQQPGQQVRRAAGPARPRPAVASWAAMKSASLTSAGVSPAWQEIIPSLGEDCTAVPADAPVRCWPGRSGHGQYAAGSTPAAGVPRISEDHRDMRASRIRAPAGQARQPCSSGDESGAPIPGRLSTAPAAGLSMQMILFGRGTGRASRPRPGAAIGGSLTGSDQPILAATPAHMCPFGAYSGYFADPDGHLRGSAGTAPGRPGARLAAPFAGSSHRADVAGTDPGRRDKRHRPFRKKKIISAERAVVFVIRHAARTRRRRARRVDVSGPHLMRSAGCTRR